MAGIHLGMSTYATENAKEFSSAIKGETIEDTMHVVCGYEPSVVVLRHYQEGAAERAAKIAEQYNVSIVNAGDGGGQHPTQALLDVYTIHTELGGVNGKIVLMGGDLKNGRTARSLAYLLSKFERVKIRFFSPPELTMKDDILEHLDEHGVDYSDSTNHRGLPDLLQEADVVYWTRFQKEREGNGADELARQFAEKYSIGREELGFMKEKSILMHPLPRVKEISPEIDEDPRSAYFRQAHYGMHVRMALLQELCKDK